MIDKPHTDHYKEIHNWIKLYVDDKEEAHNLANNLHYVGVKRCRQTFIIGVITGIIIFGMLLSWLA